MKTYSILCAFLIIAFILLQCSVNNDDKKDDDNGILIFQTVNSFTNNPDQQAGLLKVSNPALTGDTTETINTSLIIGIGDIWVSQDVVKSGESDNLDWVKLTNTTNTELILFEDYTFDPIEIPSGEYKSIKLTLRNIAYRLTELISDPAIKYELLETMGSSTDPCDENDESWAKTNYFSEDGNHQLIDGEFELVAEGEKVGGFDIEPERTTNLTMRLGAGVTTPCINYLIDKNGNREWDCGTDDIIIECPPEVQYMWDFLVDYQ